jgi:hypothetical protein
MAVAVAAAMLMAGCAASSEERSAEPPSKVTAATTSPSEPAVGETVLYLRGNVEVAVYADGPVIWPIGDGDPGYLQRRLTPAGVERLRSRAVSTGLFEQDEGLTLDHVDAPGLREHGLVRGSMDVRRGDRSVVVVWGNDRSAIRNAYRDLERISAATPEQEAQLSDLVAFFRDPTAWTLPRRMYVQPETTPFVPSRIGVVYDAGRPDWSTLPSPAREIVSSRLGSLTSPASCQVISADQARKIARALTQVGIDADYDSRRGSLGFSAAGSFVHSFPALPHEVAC